jgi:intermediate peptidase
LYGYGGSYYSYLFDRVLAKRVWQKAFASGQDGGALDRGNGEKFKEDVLKWGGARDPWKCLSNALRDERLEGGGKSAMGLVGSWGIEGGKDGTTR